MDKKLFISLFIIVLAVSFFSSPTAQEAVVSAKSSAREKIFVAIDAGGSLPDATIYALDPNGSGQTAIFDFHSQPKDARGGVWGLRHLYLPLLRR